MIADSTFLIDVFRGEPRAIALLQQHDIKTTCINEYEILLGLYRKTTNVERTKDFFEDIDVLPLTKQSIDYAARIASLLISNGEQIQDNDCLIAGIMKAHKETHIVTRNAKHFQRVDGITVVTY